MADLSGSSTRRFRLSAQAGVVGTWALLIVLGALALRLPMCAVKEPLSWIDAAFVSTSAVCVTGLSTISVGDVLAFPGQVVLLILIQLGGLGIGTISTFLLLSAGKAGVSEQFDAQESLAALRVHPFRLIRAAILITLAVEALGAGLLAMRFHGENSGWEAIFHSVSAFCNAGFSLFPDSLTKYQGSVAVNAIVAGLIVLGGLGFIVHVQFIDSLIARLRGRQLRLSLHSRTVLWANGILWLAGILVFVTLEYGNTMKPLGFGQKVLAALFQSVTMRTAGFSTIDFGALREVTVVFCMLFMLIGASPGSCGGGLKVTTAAVLIAVAHARLKGSQTVTLMDRTIPPETVMRALAVTTLSLLLIAAVTLGLLMSEGNPALTDRTHDHMTSLAFETVSAFGTVGLSTGLTAELTSLGKIMLIITMFVGRLGPLAIGLAVLGPAKRPLYAYPTEAVAIG